jgi:hypothetical protein
MSSNFAYPNANADPQSKKRKLYDFNESAHEDASLKSDQDNLLELNRRLKDGLAFNQLNIQFLESEPTRLLAGTGKIFDEIIQALNRLRLQSQYDTQNLERINEEQRAELVQMGSRVQALERSTRKWKLECFKANLRTDGVIRDNRILRANLQKDEAEFSTMRNSIRRLRAICIRLRERKDQMKEKRNRARGALNVLTGGNLGPALFLHMRGQLETRIPGNRRREVGDWVLAGYQLWLQEYIDSGESTVAEDGGSTEEDS